ncbi:DUF502 domain-containing protein [Maribacter sp. 1_MG-2023]|uniref:DUF502 domain-containing protein n=1 Tax=Maribacter sp. 1_MG-2023 TaxID=3062677 RepID=UPI0026E33228|nr:DUF502 domain-containing protein [Maribacter sp. 1_MG-2023]MDO6473345.1 DUF502 domain-containing protein [Maribacter sp. 1_MG-2023]
MNKVLSFIKRTIIDGLFLIIPIVLVIYLLGKVIGIFRKMVAPFVDRIDISLLGLETTSRILAVIILFILCFVAGILVKMQKINQFKDWVEVNILSNIPGYTLMQGVSKTAAGLDSNNLKEVVLVDIEEVWQVGFLMEKIDEDLNVVFIPGAPNPMAGNVVIVKLDRLKKLNVKGVNAMKLFRKLGVGSKTFLEGELNESIFNKK